jgi:hypothetical protein
VQGNDEIGSVAGFACVEASIRNDDRTPDGQPLSDSRQRIGEDPESVGPGPLGGFPTRLLAPDRVPAKLSPAAA